MTRREFLRSAAIACGAASALPATAWTFQERPPRGGPRPLVDRFSDLHRHFVFEYYPWYRNDPFWHWNGSSRKPPDDVAANYMPRLGAYDSRSTSVMEQHARWIADAGVGAINVSWWGRGELIDQMVPQLMDVMAAHDIHVTFHIEPYGPRRAADYARDIQYLITQYGDRRRWDCFLLLENEDGKVGPVFKQFATILPAKSTDCHGVTHDEPYYAPDSVWRQQTDLVRETFRRDFDHVTLLADSLAIGAVGPAGFDGIAIYDNYVAPETWPKHARECTAYDLLFSFNINPGFDGVVEREVEPGSCYKPLPFAPPPDSYEWSRAAERERARAASLARISESFHTTIDLQTSPSLTNAKRGFFLTYVNSFNEWHEGHQFEPMKDAAALSPGERAIGYHNPADGTYRLAALKKLLEHVL